MKVNETSIRRTTQSKVVSPWPLIIPSWHQPMSELEAWLEIPFESRMDSRSPTHPAESSVVFNELSSINAWREFFLHRRYNEWTCSSNIHNVRVSCTWVTSVNTFIIQSTGEQAEKVLWNVVKVGLLLTNRVFSWLLITTNVYCTMEKQWWWWWTTPWPKSLVISTQPAVSTEATLGKLEIKSSKQICILLKLMKWN